MHICRWYSWLHKIIGQLKVPNLSSLPPHAFSKQKVLMLSQWYLKRKKKYVRLQIKNINSIPQYPNFLSIFNYMFKLRNSLASATDLEPNYSRRQTTLSENGDPCHCFWPVKIDDLKKRVWKIIMCGMSGDTELHTGRRNSSMLARHLGIHLPSKGDQKRHFNGSI